ncbi:MAG: hypothetical protein RIR24_785 [Actinomycetota bacterium]|jgi:hypothetical protein
MQEFELNPYWEDRALSALESIVELEFNQQAFSDFMRNYLRADAQSIGFVGDFVLATCLLANQHKLKKESKFTSYISVTPEVWDVFKYGVSFAQDLLRDVKFEFEENQRGDASFFHKSIASLLIEAALDQGSDSRIKFKNDASEFTLFTDQRNLCITFNIDGQLDPGAQTLTTAFLYWMEPEGVSSSAEKTYSNYVSSRYCAGLERLDDYKRFDQFELVKRIVSFYCGLRSVSPLTIEFDPRDDSPWPLVLATLTAESDWLQIRVNPYDPVYPENWSDF